MTEQIPSNAAIEASIRHGSHRSLAEQYVVPDENESIRHQQTEAYRLFMQYEPKPIPLFVAENTQDEQTKFLNGETYTPNNHYNLLNEIDFQSDILGLQVQGEALIHVADIDPKYHESYRAVVDDYVKKTELLQAAYDYKHADSPEEIARARREFMDRNIEIYGEPDRDTYRTLLGKKLANIDSKTLTGRAAELRDELHQMLPDFAIESTAEYFQPSAETVEWMKGIVDELYGSLLEHVPEDKEEFTAEELQQLFTTIIAEEFGESAREWKIVIRDATSMNVRTPDKEIIIPTNLKPKKNAEVRKLVVHEIGVHMLRSVIGEQTDAAPLQFGTSSYYDADEGLGVVVEQALEGKYQTRGIPYYILAGAAYHEGMNFRELYEMQWRLSTLDTLKTEDIEEDKLESKQAFAYKSVTRIMRGTDDLPWFKDLSYFNGSNEIWKYLEANRGDDTQFMFLLSGGKMDPNDILDRQLAYEARSL